VAARLGQAHGKALQMLRRLLAFSLALFTACGAGQSAPQACWVSLDDAVTGGAQPSA
jgi:hypothetical protein